MPDGITEFAELDLMTEEELLVELSKVYSEITELKTELEGKTEWREHLQAKLCEKGENAA